MKKILLTLSSVILAVASMNAQGFVAGWDFKDVPALDTAVDGYAAEKTAINNGFATSGSISTSLTQGSQVFFAANGNAATAPGFGDGFDQTTTDLFGGSETGQQSLNFTAGSAFNVVFNFSDSYDVVINADWLTSSTGGGSGGDILDISYSADAGSTWTTYNKADGEYVALASTSGWIESDGDAGGFIGFVSSQSDMSIDLTSVTDVSSTVNAVRFEFSGLSAGERVGLDNVHINGVAVVPEPSTYAVIFGSIALAIAAVRRRR